VIPVTIVVLTLNEIEGVQQMLSKLPVGPADEVLVVDGGSTDGTVEFCEERGYRVVRQTRRGRGDAFRQAVAHARHEALVFFSPDGNEEPAEIPRLVDGLERGYDMVIASRFMPGARSEDDDKFLFASRRWGNLTFTWLANALFRGPVRITDTINGYRAITRTAFRRLAPDAEGYAIEFQMSMRAMRRGLRVLEIPTHEGPRIGVGVSKLNAIPVGFTFLGVMLREWVS
jgi:glycosyltransferase involved in cell wall biosynthesis